MKKEQTLGLLREVLTASGALAFAGFAGWPSVVGLLVLLASVIWSLAYHEGAEIVYTTTRKLLSAAPGVLVELGVLNTMQGANATALLLPLAALVWSYYSNGNGNRPNFPSSLWILALFLTLFIPSCAGGGKFSFFPTGEGCVFAKYKTQDGRDFVAGSCINPETGKFSTYETRWTLEDGTKVKAIRHIGSSDYRVFYEQDGSWVEYDSKSGLSFGTVPTIQVQ